MGGSKRTATSSLSCRAGGRQGSHRLDQQGEELGQSFAKSLEVHGSRVLGQRLLATSGTSLPSQVRLMPHPVESVGELFYSFAPKQLATYAFYCRTGLIASEVCAWWASSLTGFEAELGAALWWNEAATCASSRKLGHERSSPEACLRMLFTVASDSEPTCQQ